MSAIAGKNRRLLGFALLIAAATGLYAANEKPTASAPTAGAHSRFADVARELVVPTIMDRHSKLHQSSEGLKFLADLKRDLAAEFDSKIERRMLGLQDLPVDFDREILDQLRGGKQNVLQLSPDSKQLRYYAALHASNQCLGCHYHKDSEHQQGDLIGVVIMTTRAE